MKLERLPNSGKKTNLNHSPDLDNNDQSMRNSVDSSIINSSIERLGSIVGSYEKPKGMDALRVSLLEEEDAYKPKPSNKIQKVVEQEVMEMDLNQPENRIDDDSSSSINSICAVERLGTFILD